MASDKDPKASGQPLFIVDHDWLKQDFKARKSWTGNVRNRSLYGLAIQVSEHGPSSKEDHSGKRSRRKRRSKTPNDNDSDSTFEQEPRFSQQPGLSARSASVPPIQNAGSLFPRKPSYSLLQPGSTSDNETVSLSDHYHQLPEVDTDSSSLGQTTYPQIDMDKYIELSIISQHPTEMNFLLRHDSMDGFWFPIIFADNLWLQKMTMFSGTRLGQDSRHLDLIDLDPVMALLLSQLRQRIRVRDFSDITIMGVACLSLIEHFRSNDERSDVHANGLLELVRARGGIDSIEHSQRLKILRADIIRSADKLQPPMLRRPLQDPTTWTKRESLASDSTFAGLLRDIADNVTYSATMASLWNVKGICQDIEAASNGHSTLDAVSYYESLLHTNHDLLSITQASGYEEILRISMLHLTQPMFRFGAFYPNNCQSRSAKLRATLESFSIDEYDRTIALWILFIGYMFSLGTTDHTYFRLMLQMALDRHQIPRKGAWTTLNDELKQFIWIDCIHGVSGRYFYAMLEEDGSLEYHSIMPDHFSFDTRASTAAWSDLKSQSPRTQ